MVYSDSTMTPNPQEVLDLATRIVETQSLLAELNRKWESMFSHNGVSTVTRAKRDDSFAAKVKAALASEPGRIFTIAEVAEITEKDSLTVGRTLFRLSNTGHAINAGRGKYRAIAQEGVS
jgi:hypothetical protein